MHHKGRFPNTFFGTSLRPDSAALAIMVLLLFLIFLFLFLTLTAQPAQGQTYQVIHDFSLIGADGAWPYDALTIDSAGNLYGTTYRGGYWNYGSVFKLSLTDSGWIYSTMYSFQGPPDAACPMAGVTIGPHGALYGATTGGGDGSGAVFDITPSATACKSLTCPWTDTVLHRFTGSGDGIYAYGGVIFDQVGNIYGTTLSGGGGGCGLGCGIVYKLTPFGGAWTESILYSFNGGNGGQGSTSGMIFDKAGNLYGTAAGGAFGAGIVFQLVPSGSVWTLNVLYTFQGGSDGSNPSGPLIFDQSGNLYGATSGGPGSSGTIFMLSPSTTGWKITVLYAFTGPPNGGPWSGLVMDRSGNLYGTTYVDGTDGVGSVFELTRSGGNWTYTSLHDFTDSDGSYPIAGVVLDTNGNIYGTTTYGGEYGFGVVWEITP